MSIETNAESKPTELAETDEDGEWPTVYIAPPKSRYSESRYHISDDCARFPSSPKEWSEDQAVDWGFDPCPYCCKWVVKGWADTDNGYNDKMDSIREYIAEQGGRDPYENREQPGVNMEDTE